MSIFIIYLSSLYLLEFDWLFIFFVLSLLLGFMFRGKGKIFEGFIFKIFVVDLLRGGV